MISIALPTSRTNKRQCHHPAEHALRLFRPTRAEPNLLRTLEKLRAAGLVRMEQAGRRKVPIPVIARILVEIDPYSANDRMHVEPA